MARHAASKRFALSHRAGNRRQRQRLRAWQGFAASGVRVPLIERWSSRRGAPRCDLNMQMSSLAEPPAPKSTPVEARLERSRPRAGPRVVRSPSSASEELPPPREAVRAEDRGRSLALSPWCREKRASSITLAGALGRPVWALLRYDADWRWMTNRADSPWYPTMRLFRQEREGDWRSVVGELAAALRTEGPKWRLRNASAVPE